MDELFKVKSIECCVFYNIRNPPRIAIFDPKFISMSYEITQMESSTSLCAPLLSRKRIFRHDLPQLILDQILSSIGIDNYEVHVFVLKGV